MSAQQLRDSFEVTFAAVCQDVMDISDDEIGTDKDNQVIARLVTMMNLGNTI